MCEYNAIDEAVAESEEISCPPGLKDHVAPYATLISYTTLNLESENSKDFHTRQPSHFEQQGHFQDRLELRNEFFVPSKPTVGKTARGGNYMWKQADEYVLC